MSSRRKNAQLKDVDSGVQRGSKKAGSPARGAGKFVFDASSYPALPGVYIMKDAAGEVIYVGKANSLRSRLSSYFRENHDSPKTSALVSHISSIEFVVSRDATEALILEQNLIKNYLPRYNIMLKDAKSYSYLAITKEKFPRLLTARKNSSGAFRIKAARFFGPYTEASKREISARYLRKLFKIRVCKSLPKKECLQYHLGNCDAPCINKISGEDYRGNVESLISVLEGKRGARGILKSLERRMEDASASLDYELAASLRDQAEALRIFFERQRVEKARGTDEDYLWFERVGDTLYVQRMQSFNGVISGVSRLSAKIRAQEDAETAFCMQHYEVLPSRVYSNLPPSTMEKLNSAFSTKAFRKPGREKAKILAIAKSSLMHGEIAPAVLKLKEALSLSSNPVAIEAFDISTLFGEGSVGSMVRFSNGKPDKANYRKFRIRDTSTQDDFAMMHEVVHRRYSGVLKRGEALPDLVLIDGGLGQLHSASSALSELGIATPLISLAKKEEEIYSASFTSPLRLPRSNPALKLLQACRDEAHRFAVSYHRKRRGMSHSHEKP